MAVAVMQQSCGAYMTVGIATQRIADIQWDCNFTQSVIPLCGQHSYRNSALQYGKQAGGRSLP
jgi:hypothetical protein